MEEHSLNPTASLEQETNNFHLAEAWFKQFTGKETDLQGMLFLIGIQELGKGPRSYSKEEKQDLMHIATCKLLSQEGYYRFLKHDKQGWPHYEQQKPLPAGGLLAQEELLKTLVVKYLFNQGYLTHN